MAYSADVYVTAANPPPGRETPLGGGSLSPLAGSQSDNGMGMNVYVAGGTGVSGSIPVYLVNPPPTGSPIGVPPPTGGTGFADVAVVSSVPVEMTGAVMVAGTASVAVVSLPTPLQVTGTVTTAVAQPGTSAHTSFPATTSSVVFLAANSLRISFSVCNFSDQRIFIHMGAAASPSVWTLTLPPHGLYESPFPAFVGQVTAFAAASGADLIHVVELLP